MRNLQLDELELASLRGAVVKVHLYRNKLNMYQGSKDRKELEGDVLIRLLYFTTFVVQYIYPDFIYNYHPP